MVLFACLYNTALCSVSDLFTLQSVSRSLTWYEKKSPWLQTPTNLHFLLQILFVHLATD